MTDWRRALEQPGVAVAVDAAARELMAEVCADPPERCSCRENLMTPLEVADWIQRQLVLEQGKPPRLDHLENRRGGQRRRYGSGSNLSAASA